MSIDVHFSCVTYQGSFRDFQLRLLDKLKDRLDERKLNIIIPPGSGKLTVGLELICRKEPPCLILTSTPVTCRLWGERFRQEFLPEDERANLSKYVSFDLKHPAPITVITYRALMAAVNKSLYTEDSMQVDFSDLDVIRHILENKIETVVLDESHHLGTRCQEALETFLGVLGTDVKLLSLTSTPPYDVSMEEWARYIAICGTFSDEIYIPELVKANILCPHRDYIYFNNPQPDEAEGIRGYRIRADKALAEVVTLPFVPELNRRLAKIRKKRVSYLYQHCASVVALLELLEEFDNLISLPLYRHLTGLKNVRPLSLEAAEEALNFLLESRTILQDDEKEQLKQTFINHRLMEHGRVRLAMTEKVRRTMVSSPAKLKSIATITETEDRSLGANLRELVLTDLLSPEELAHWDDSLPTSHISAISVFDTLQKETPHIPLGLMTEASIILPRTAAALLDTQCGIRATVSPVPPEDYASYTFSDHTTAMVAMEYLFKAGHIRVLIGAGQLLSSGWDDTFVNTLIMATFSGTLVDAHRIRGRVIHADKDAPDKIAHIWHLCTLENAYSLDTYPELYLASRAPADESGVRSVDLQSLRRYFECYMGPDDLTGDITNGIGCLSAIPLPYNADDPDAINRITLEKAADRGAVAACWKEAITDTSLPIAEVLVPKTAKVPVFTRLNTIGFIFASIGVTVGAYYAGWLLYFVYFCLHMPFAIIVAIAVFLAVGAWIIFLLSLFFMIKFLPLLFHHTTPKRSIRAMCRALYRTFLDLGHADKEAVMVFETMPDKRHLRIYLDHCTRSQQADFAQAVSEMLSAINNDARYIMVRPGPARRLRWRWSFTCPSIIAKADISVKHFAKHIHRCLSGMKFQYTRREAGVRQLIFARNHSYLNDRDCKCFNRLRLIRKTKQKSQKESRTQ